MSGLQRAFFCNSGTEAVEACLKFARRYWYSKGIKNRTHYVALEHGFSGRSMGALSVTANAHYREPFEPLIPGVTFVAPDDIKGLEAAITGQTAAIIAEPIQGEGGVRPLSPEFAAAIARVTKATGTLLIADEIQCGLGRTGRPFHFQSFGWTPDLVTVGKAIGSGVPIGAALVAEHVAKEVFAGDHGSTYGGNLLATRAALYVLGELDRLAPQVRETGQRFEQKLAGLQQKHKVVTGVKGAGLMQGLHLSVDALPVVEASLKAGLLVNRTAEKVVRMLPPLTVTAAEIDEAVTILDGALASLSVEEVKA
jgi:acetylornithine/succinyldiaminopimelate/putrescine aminotransferase